MKKKRFKVEEIIKILREAQGGVAGAEIARRHNISEQTLYRWKRKYGGMEISEARRLKVLEDENARLKKKLAETVLELEIAREAASKNW